MAVQVTWLRPRRLPASQRAALTQLLVTAAEGLPLRSDEVRDSRPSDCGLRIADWPKGDPLIPNPRSPIRNPQSED
jgi:hypothetical protein